MSIPKHGETRGGERYDRPSFAWISADEWQARQWAREDRIFAKAACQGQPCAPMVLTDACGSSIEGLQSQADGKYYDSKSQLRKHYRDAGVIEVGNDVPKTRFIHGDKPPRDPMTDRRQEAAIHKAFNRLGIPPV